MQINVCNTKSRNIFFYFYRIVYKRDNYFLFNLFFIFASLYTIVTFTRETFALLFYLSDSHGEKNLIVKWADGRFTLDRLQGGTSEAIVIDQSRPVSAGTLVHDSRDLWQWWICTGIPKKNGFVLVSIDQSGNADRERARREGSNRMVGE